jgi:hypothetical protein
VMVIRQYSKLRGTFHVPAPLLVGFFVVVSL